MNIPLKIPLQLQRQRQQKHQKLMKMISSYELSREQKVKLQKIRSHTMLEINLRFLRSQINRNYKFPKFNKLIQTINPSQQSNVQNQQNEEQSDKQLRQQIQQFSEKSRNKKRPGQYLTYDLRSQNQSKSLLDNKDNELMTYSNKIISLDQSRRVHSLGNQKSLEKQTKDFITKRHNPIKNSKQRFQKSPQNIGQSKSTRSLKTIKPISLTRRQSKQKVLFDPSPQKHSPLGTNSKKLMVDSRKLKLPEINSISSNQLKTLRKLNPMHQKLKTQKYYAQEQIQYAIGKKLVTQATDSGKKPIKGVQKYLKQIETQKKQQYHFNLNLNNQPSKLMKKQKDPQKRKGNFQVFQSAKNSLKRQIE